jgi:hypothetical protein
MNVIYFIAADNCIKIGTTKNLRARVASLRTSSAGEIEVIGTIDGGFEIERAIHFAVREHHLRGEWFADCEQLRAWIKNLIERGPEAMGVPSRVTAISTARLLPPNSRDPEAIQKIVRLMWADEAVAELVAFTGEPEPRCRAWLAGTGEFSRLIRYALAAVVMQWMAGRPNSFLSETSNEKASA